MTRYSVNIEKSILTFNWAPPSLSIWLLQSITPLFVLLDLLLHPSILLLSLTPSPFPSDIHISCFCLFLFLLPSVLIPYLYFSYSDSYNASLEITNQNQFERSNLCFSAWQCIEMSKENDHVQMFSCSAVYIMCMCVENDYNFFGTVKDLKMQKMSCW